jgi:predicted dehydrogenase
MKKNNKNFSRRDFVKAASISMAGITFLPSCGGTDKTVAANDLRLGFIGLGRRSVNLLDAFINMDGVKVIAGCDVYGRKRERFKNTVSDFYEEKKINSELGLFEDFRELLAQKDIDAVVIVTPDHWHAINAIQACKAGKDVYLEKPMTFTIKEGQELVKAVRTNNRILAVGSQQRSDPNFQHAVKLAQSGTLGKIEKINAYVGAPPIPYNLPEEPVPGDLNWDFWLGPLPGDIHFNNELNPPITIDPPKKEEIWGAWRWYEEMGGGFTTDWGAHMFDIAQWGLGMDGNGPVEASPIGDGTEFMQFKYADGVVMSTEPFDEKLTKGVKFWGEKGWIEVSRDHFAASDSSWLPESQKTDEGVAYERQGSHYQNFIDALQKRIEPQVPVEVGHSSCTVCTIGNIACKLGRTVKWDPVKQVFVDDEDGKASSMLHYDYRVPWTL